MVKYIDIANDIRTKIKDETYTYGQKLPYEYVLCVTYHCNKETMKKALDILVKEGLIIRRRGAGTFVKDYNPSVDDVNTIAGIISRPNDQDDVKMQVISFDVIPCKQDIAEYLQIEEGSFIYRLVRCRIINDYPSTVEITHIPISILPNLRKENVEESLYGYLQTELNLKIQSMHKTIRASLSTELEQKYLNIPVGEPYFEVAQISYLNNGIIFEYSNTRMRYKDFELKTVVVL